MPTTTALSGADPGIGARLHNVIVIGTHAGGARRSRTEIELDELEELARTLEARVMERRLVSLREPHPATYLRAGGVEQVEERITELDGPAVLFNDNLSPRQQRNLEKAWGVPVLDRTEVILAIFARRARTAEGKVQVEMAQLEHLLPRLAGGWTHLERQRGGVGLRGGAGEKQIEVDRRIIGQKMRRLRKQLEELKQRRATQRSARTDVPLASCALVGYTNAGKSTLLNKLTNSTVFADNLLFATLDPTSRLLGLPSGRRVIVTDTVGFIQNLPTELVEAFAATLEEVRQARILTVVVDGSHPEAEAQLTTVLETLEDMECNQPALLVVSKVDQIPKPEIADIAARLGQLAGTEPVLVSAVAGTGIRELRSAIDTMAGRVVPDSAANRTPTTAGDWSVVEGEDGGGDPSTEGSRAHRAVTEASEHRAAG